MQIKERIRLLQTDITGMEVEAIVNAANSSLLGGGGVDGAIHRAGGPAILDACRKIIARQGKCSPGEAVITTGGNLPARFVIHTVGPVWQNGTKMEAEKLAACYRNSLELAVENKIKSIAFPNISTGIYGYPRTEAATVAIRTVMGFLEKDAVINTLYFVCLDRENFLIYQNMLN